MTNMLRGVVIWGELMISGKMNYSHMECLLHDYGIPASEVMTVIRHISKTDGGVSEIHRRMEH